MVKLWPITPAVTDFTVTEERSAVITFCEPITLVYNMFFIKNPIGGLNLLAYFEPLHYMSWMAIGAFVILAPFALFISSMQDDYYVNILSPF